MLGQQTPGRLCHAPHPLSLHSFLLRAHRHGSKPITTSAQNQRPKATTSRLRLQVVPKVLMNLLHPKGRAGSTTAATLLVLSMAITNFAAAEPSPSQCTANTTRTHAILEICWAKLQSICYLDGERESNINEGTQMPIAIHAWLC